MALLSAAADLPAGLVSPTIRRLPNGLTVIAEQMHLDAVNLSLWLRVGSAMESDAINGMAHFLEHMIFKGTQQMQCGEFERRVEERGAFTNAATSQDYTKYYVTTAPQDFAALAPLQIQMVMAPRLSDDDFERERSVILEEIRRADDDPRRRTYRRTMELTFDRLPYRRPVLGPAAVVEGLTAQQMREFHRTWYQPQSMTAVAVGNLPVEVLITTVAEGFDQAMAQRQAASVAAVDSIERFKPLLPGDLEPPFATVRRVVHHDQALTQARLVMIWRVPGMANLDDTYGLDILASVLGRGLTSRLVCDLREERKLVTSISCSNMTLTHQGVFMVSARLSPKHLSKVEAAIAEHIHAVVHQPVSQAELQRVQTQVANRFVFANETPSDRAGLYGYYHTLTGDITDGVNYPTYIQQLTVEDVFQTAQRYLSADAYGMLALHPSL
ncbi:MAG: pitrilysin family protein [Cyanobacteria bacterium J06638_6]